MKKTDEKYQAYINILKEELIPAMGCTEPIDVYKRQEQIKALLDQLENDWAAAEGGWSDLDESLSYARSGSYSGTGDSREDPTATPSEEPYWIPEEVDEEYGAMDSDLEQMCIRDRYSDVERAKAWCSQWERVRDGLVKVVDSGVSISEMLCAGVMA